MTWYRYLICISVTAAVVIGVVISSFIVTVAVVDAPAGVVFLVVITADVAVDGAASLVADAVPSAADGGVPVNLMKSRCSVKINLQTF